ncbi:MAG TPA: AarF/ABC1/UbiB kinase family protein [Solirubrobacteraceae bacterium]
MTGASSTSKMTHEAASSGVSTARAREHRERQIAEVLGRYGLSHLADVVGLKRLIGAADRLIGREPPEVHTEPEKLRLALEELGPTFIKLGQLLSTRADLLSDDYRSELSKLQDAAPAVPSEAVQEIVERELHAPANTVFASFEAMPLACASVGQAHAATLHDGTDVVVKVRRPNVVEDMEQDLEILQNFAARASRHSKVAARHDVVGLADEFVTTLRAQLDYLQEARNAERFSANFAGDPRVQIPRVFPDLTTSRVITLERIRGMKITDLTALDEAGLDRHELANRTALITAKMIFEDGFFHADPHPGNFFIEPTGRIGVIDFGMVGTLDDRLRDQLSRLLNGFLRQDPGRLADALLAPGISTGEVDRARLREDLANLLSRQTGRSLGEISLRSAFGEILEIVRRHRLRVPPDLSLLFTMLIIAEGVAAAVDPGFGFAEALAPYARSHLLSGLTATDVRRRLEQFGIDLAELTAELPARLDRITEAIDTGGLEVHVRTDEMDALLARVERLGNRVAASVIAAAFIDTVVQLATQRRRHKPWPRRGRSTATSRLGVFVLPSRRGRKRS